ncbi:GTP-binding protein [Pseudomonas putida]
MIPPSKGIDFFILTGPLGSGKTTLLEHLFQHDEAGSGTVVIVNEAGAVNIDGAVLVDSVNGLTIEMLSNGCVCCSLSNDLVSTVQDLIESRARMNLPPFERIILECSGLSIPGEVLRSLNGLAQLQMAVGIICTYDCSSPPLDGEQFKAVAAQLSAAHTVVLTKLDMVSRVAQKEARETVTRLNPFALVIEEQSLSLRSESAFSSAALRSTEAITPDPKVLIALPHPRINVYHAQLKDAELDDVLDWLENITGSLGEKLLRNKTLIAVESTTVLMQTVGTTFSAPRKLKKTNDARSIAIFITQDCTLEELTKIPRSFEADWQGITSPS